MFNNDGLAFTMNNKRTDYNQCSLVIKSIRDEIESHTKNSGVWPDSLAVAPFVYDLLEEEAKSKRRVELQDGHDGLYIVGVKIELDDDLSAFDIG